MKRAFQCWTKNTDGVASIEIGLLLPLFIAALFPPIEYARYSFTEHVLISSVNDAAMLAAFNLANPDSSVTEDDIKSFVIENAGNYAPSMDEIEITYAPRAEPGARVTVTAKVDFETVIDLFGDLDLSVSGTRTLF